MPLSRSVSKVRHMTGSGWALAELTLDLWVTSHSNREPSSYPATRRGPEVESVWSNGRMIREKMKTKRREDVNAEWKALWCWELSGAEVIILEAPADTQGCCGLHSSACWALSRNSLQHCSLYSSSVLLTPAFKKEGTNPSFLF